jgi:hypothetical protein
MLFGSECFGLSICPLLNSILFDSDYFLASMCSYNSSPRVYNPTCPMNKHDQACATSKVERDLRPSTDNTSPAKNLSLSMETLPDPPRLRPLSSFKTRKLDDLSVSATSSPLNLGSALPRISCSRNIDLRRKSLSERHFFRPVSEDEELSTGSKQK